MLHILHQTAALLVLHKPAGLVCHPTKGDDTTSLVGRVRLHLGPGRSFHLINRLDRETSGVTLVALDDTLARELRRAWEQRRVRKEYLAIVHGHSAEDHFEIDAPLGRDESSPVAIKDCVRPDGAAARTEVTVLRRFTRREGAFTLLRVEPETGRKHQIRIHLAHAGLPIVGDKIYGGDPTIYLRFVEGRMTAADRACLLLEHHALHAAAVEIPGAAADETGAGRLVTEMERPGGADGFGPSQDTSLVVIGQRFEASPEPEFSGFCAV